MISNTTRRLYYSLMSVPMRINHWRYRWISAPRSGLRVHLGCGQHYQVPGWLNVDANIMTVRPDLWIDFLHGLPFRDASVSVFYLHHVLEHLAEDRLPGFLMEMYRCLEPGGGVRIGVPHAGNAFRMYVAGRAEWFADFPHPRKSIGGRCANFLLCANEHLALLDFSYLRELLTDAGFVGVTECLPIRESNLVGEEILSLEYEWDFETPHTLIVEARKP